MLEMMGIEDEVKAIWESETHSFKSYSLFSAFHLSAISQEISNSLENTYDVCFTLIHFSFNENIMFLKAIISLIYHATH